jgi:hypothetical protein
MISNLCVITCCCLRKFFLYQTEIKIAKLGNIFKSIDGSSDDNHCILIAFYEHLIMYHKMILSRSLTIFFLKKNMTILWKDIFY